MGWLITLGILVILAWLPLGATVRYNDQGVTLKVIAGPVRIPILPKKKAQEKEKPKKEEKPKKKQPVAKKTEAPKPQEEKGGPVTDFLPLVYVALDLLADKYGIETWTNCESFDRDMPFRFPPIKWEKLRLKLKAAEEAGIENAITFEFSHFLSPHSMYKSAGGLFDRYCEENGIPARSEDFR